MGATVSHSLTATTPDHPAYEIQPSHWNEAHAITLAAVGSEISGAFDNGGGVTFGLSANGKITASAPGGGAGFSAGVSGGNTAGDTGATGTRVVFAGGNNITLSQATNANGASITVSGPHVSQYLTTAALSNHSHGNPTLNLTNLTGTTASNSAGFTLSLSGNAAQTVQSALEGFGVSNVGNTAGDTGISTGIDVVLAGSGSITLSQATAAGRATVHIQHPAWLTTAALSNHSHGNPTLNLTNLSGTTASNSAGFTLSLSAAAPGGAGFVAGASNVGNTAGDTGVTGTRLVLVGSDNVTLSQATGAAGATVSFFAPAPGAAAEANAIHLVGANTAGNTTATGSTIGWSGVNVTLSGKNDSQVVISVAAQSVQTQASGAIPRSGFTTTTVGGAVVAGTNNTDGLLLAVPAYLTTAAQSNAVHAAIVSGANGNLTQTTGTLSVKAGNNITLSTGANVYSIHGVAAQTEQTQNLFAAIVSGANGNLTQTSGTLSFKAGNNITLSTGANVFSIHGVAAQTAQSAIEGLGVSNVGNTAGDTGVVTGVDFILAGSGSITLSQQTAAAARTIHIQHPAWLTTAALSNHSHGNPQLNLTNLSGTTASNSAGFTLSLSAAAPGAAAEANAMHLLGANTAGNTTATGSTIGWSGINLTLSGTNDSRIAISAPATSSLHATGCVSISTNGSTISIGAPAEGSLSFVEIMDGARFTTNAVWNNATFSRRPMFIPFQVENALMSCGTIRLFASRSSGTVLVATMFAGIYSRANSTSMNLISSTSMNISVTTSAQYSGVRMYDITGLGGLSLSPGGYVLGLLGSMAASDSLPLHLMGGDQAVLAGFVNSGTNQTAATNSQSHILPFWGVWNATSGGLPSAVAMSSISGGNGANSPDIYAIIKAI